MVECPLCGSRDLRFSRRLSPTQRLWSLTGIRPLRCRHCRGRFTARTWRLSSLMYARCPKCWRMDLNFWSRKDYYARFFQRLFLRLGAHPYRCEYCRHNFVSYRALKEKFTFKRWAKRARTRAAAGVGSGNVKAIVDLDSPGPEGQSE